MSWEIHNNSLSPEIFNQVNGFIKDEYGDNYFSGTCMVIGFWEDVQVSGEYYSSVSCD